MPRLLMKNINVRINSLHQIVEAHAPSDEACAVVQQLYSQAIMDGASDEDIEKMFAQMICDGLTHGNWPWLVAALSDATASDTTHSEV